MIALPSLPAIAVGEVRHTRRRPIAHSVRMRTHLWLVDLAALPEGRFAPRFRTRDHFSGTASSIGTALTRFATAHGERVHPQDRLIMLAAPRAFGHVFNPLSVHWCLDAAGDVRFAVLEVHNTYAERHAYLIHPDTAGRAVVDKQFYVSPFFAVEGRYRVRLGLTPARASVGIVLEDDGPVFAASFRGLLRPATSVARVRAGVRTPLVPLQTSARIRWHGIRLWRRLPVHERPVHRPPAGMR